MFKYTINYIPPSNNKFIGNSKNFNIYRREKERWHWLIRAAITSKPKQPIEKAEIHIRYYFKDKRRRDPDNYSGKMILDPLVQEGILQDDSFSNVRLILSAAVDSQKPRVEITVKEQSYENCT